MFKRMLVSAIYAACTLVDRISFLPIGPVRRLGCPSGLGLRAARLEDHWGLVQPPVVPGRPQNPGAGQ